MNCGWEGGSLARLRWDERRRLLRDLVCLKKLKCKVDGCGRGFECGVVPLLLLLPLRLLLCVYAGPATKPPPAPSLAPPSTSIPLQNDPTAITSNPAAAAIHLPIYLKKWAQPTPTSWWKKPSPRPSAARTTAAVTAADTVTATTTVTTATRTATPSTTATTTPAATGTSAKKSTPQNPAPQSSTRRPRPRRSSQTSSSPLPRRSPLRPRRPLLLHRECFSCRRHRRRGRW